MASEKKESGGDESKPDLAGDAAKIADTKVMTLLFGRSAKAAGDFLGEKTEGFFNRLKEEAQQAEKKNVADHVLNVANVNGTVPKLTEIHIIKFERWAKVAADVPAQDTERSAVVDAALDDLFSTTGTPAFEEAAEKLTSDGARLLLNAPTDHGVNPNEKDQRTFEQLANLGLISTPRRASLLGQVGAWFVGTAIGLAILFGLILRYLPTVIPRYVPSLLEIEFVIDAVVVSAAAVAFGIIFVATRYRLTALGRSLQQSAARFYRGDQTPRKVSFFASIFDRPWFAWGGLSIVVTCVLPLLLQSILPMQLRFNQNTPTVIISSVPPQPPLPPSPQPPPNARKLPEQVTITSDELAKLIGLWKSVSNQLGPEIDGASALLPRLKAWQRLVIAAFSNEQSDMLKEQKRKSVLDLQSKLVSDLNLFQDQAVSRRVSLDTLANAYRNYPNVPSVLNNTVTDRIAGRYQEAKDSFVRELNNLPTQPRFDEIIAPYIDELDGALIDLVAWAVKTRDVANQQVDELSKAPSQEKK